jgi:hypothetical protein
MSGKFRVQVSLNKDGAVSEDVIVNTYHFDSDQTFGEDADDVAERVRTFYNAIAQYCDSKLADTGTIKVYDLAEPEPRVPGVTLPFTWTPAGGTDFPSEVAVVLTMKAAAVAGENPRRRRGRVFLPVNGTGSLGPVVNGDVTVAGFARDAILAAAEAMAHGPDPGDARLAVFSPTEAGGQLNNQWSAAQLDAGFNDVVELSIDNRYDIIRKRGARATARTTLPVT